MMAKALIAICPRAAAAAQDAKVTQVLTKDLTGTSGKEAAIVTVEYAPGGTSAAHRHNAHTFVYVLEGSMLMQVKGGKEVTLGPGQTFYESPDDVHKGVIIVGHVRRLAAQKLGLTNVPVNTSGFLRVEVSDSTKLRSVKKLAIQLVSGQHQVSTKEAPEILSSGQH